MKKHFVSLFFFILLPVFCFSADIFVPTLELLSRMYSDSGVFTMQTNGSFEMNIEGGYKFGGKLKIGIENAVVDDINDLPALEFHAAEVSINDLFDLPFSISYYTGIIDDFCSGDIFHTYFGTGIIEPNLSGYMAFSDGINYDGLHSVAGTGISLSSNFGTDWNYTKLYVYQDAYLGSGFFSADANSAFNLGDLKIEGFVGASFPVSTAGIYRAGILLFYKASDTGSFLAQIGIPRWDPVIDPFGINLFYFLFEPRLNFGIFGINLSFFWHPSYYHNIATNEGGAIDLLLDFQVGDYEEFPVTGGLSTKLAYNAALTTDQFKTIVSPYIGVVTSGVLWNLKLNITVLPFDLSTMFEGYIGIKAEF
ncbi:MAG: hypothetical protein JEZ04_16435 [Spirochaetales bacterium]|nr:hypothetical protein [Spirochaetales bacterium]